MEGAAALPPRKLAAPRCRVEEQSVDGLEFSKQCDEQCEVDNLNEPRLCKVCKLNVVLGDMLSCDFGRLDAWDDALGRFVFPIDSRFKVESVPDLCELRSRGPAAHGRAQGPHPNGGLEHV